MALLKDKAITFLDIETTGLDPIQQEIIEVGFVRHNPDGTVLEWESKFKPQRMETAEPKALEINGYSEEAWKDAPLFNEHARLVADALSNCLIVGHNVSFDIGFILEAMKRTGVRHRISYHKIDTVTLAYEHLAPCGLHSLSLANVCNFLGISNDGAHTAMDDAKRCQEVYFKLLRATPEQRMEWAARR